MDDCWTSRVGHAQEALRRGRYAFIAATIFSVAIIVGEFNSDFSWYKQFALDLGKDDRFQSISHPNRFETEISSGPMVSGSFFTGMLVLPSGTFPFSVTTTSTTSMAASKSGTNSEPQVDESVTTELQKELLRDWVESKRVTIGLLGVNIGMSDAAILGSLSLWILTLWVYYASRRENHIIGSLLIEAAHTADSEVRKCVYYGIAEYTVFVTVSDSDESIKRLDQPKRELQSEYKMRWVVAFLFMLPALAIALIFIGDIYTICTSAPMRYPHAPLLKYLVDSRRNLAVTAIMEAVALVFCVCTSFYCLKALDFQNSTGAILLAFYNKFIRDHESPPESSKKEAT